MSLLELIASSFLDLISKQARPSIIKKLVLSSKDKARAARGGVRRHAPPETPFLVFWETNLSKNVWSIDSYFLCLFSISEEYCEY